MVGAAAWSPRATQCIAKWSVLHLSLLPRHDSAADSKLKPCCMQLRCTQDRLPSHIHFCITTHAVYDATETQGEGASVLKLARTLLSMLSCCGRHILLHICGVSACQAVVIGGKSRERLQEGKGCLVEQRKGSNLPEAHEVEACTAEHAVALLAAREWWRHAAQHWLHPVWVHACCE